MSLFIIYVVLVVIVLLNEIKRGTLTVKYTAAEKPSDEQMAMVVTVANEAIARKLAINCFEMNRYGFRNQCI